MHSPSLQLLFKKELDRQGSISACRLHVADEFSEVEQATLDEALLFALIHENNTCWLRWIQARWASRAVDEFLGEACKSFSKKLRSRVVSAGRTKWCLNQGRTLQYPRSP